MTQIIPTIIRMTFEEADLAGLHSSMTLEYEGRTYRLNSGTSDNMYVLPGVLTYLSSP